MKLKISFAIAIMALSLGLFSCQQLKGELL